MPIPSRLALLAAFALASLLPSCGDAEPRFRQKTAAEWAADVWSPVPADALRAMNALREFAKSHPNVVLDALAAQLVAPRPSATSTPFSVRLDTLAAKRLSLGAIEPPEALAIDLPLLRNRLLAAGIAIGSLRGDSVGNVDIVLVGGRSRADAERIQRFACRRGAFDLRAVLVAPTAPESEATAFASWLETERARLDAATKASTAYVPSRGDRSLVPVATDATVVAIELPQSDVDAFDERMVASARGFVDGQGVARVELVVAPPRLEALSRWAQARMGREVVVLRDGVVVERRQLTAPIKDRVTIVAVGEAGSPPDAARLAREDAAVLSTGRMSWPLEPVPIDDQYGADPKPSNVVSRTLSAIGEPAIPSLERVRSSNAPEWSKKSAAWAIEAIRKAALLEATSPK